MCAGTLYWGNVGRLVYGIAERALLDLTGDDPQNPTLDMPCRLVLAKGQKPIRVWGPCEEGREEVVAVHRDFWQGKAD